MRRPLIVVIPLAVAVLAGCGSPPEPQTAPAPALSTPSVADRSASTAVSNAADTVGSIPGSPDALFVYRF